jgi:hypothetical protein
MKRTAAKSLFLDRFALAMRGDFAVPAIHKAG